MTTRNSLKVLTEKVLPARALLHLRALDHYFNGEWELRQLHRLVDPTRMAIDVGANIGIYSYFLNRCGAKVIAYEPNPDLAQKLREVLPAVAVRELALSDSVGESVFSVPVDETGRAVHELGSVAQVFDGDVRSWRVKCTTLDAEDWNDVGFLKIDVEQHERAVLRGAMATVRNSRPVIFVEVYPLKYEQTVPNEFAFVLREGYIGWFSFAKRWIPFERFDATVHADSRHFGHEDRFMGNNVVFFPNEHPLAQTGL